MNSLRMIVWNVKNGNSITVFTPNGKRIQFDIGASDDCSPLTQMKDWCLGRTIDTLVITHPHGDHLRDIEFIASGLYDVKTLLRPRQLTEDEIRDANGPNDAKFVDAYIELSNQYSAKPQPGTSALQSENNGGVMIRHFTPTGSSHSNINNHSIVSFITYGQDKILLPGDCEAPAWNELLKNSRFCKELAGVTILVAAHHGHKSGYCADVMSRMRNSLRLVIISDGKYQEDISATSNYSNACNGCNVIKHGSVQPVSARCVTTRKNGWIDVCINERSFTVKVEK